MNSFLSAKAVNLLMCFHITKKWPPRNERISWVWLTGSVKLEKNKGGSVEVSIEENWLKTSAQPTFKSWVHAFLKVVVDLLTSLSCILEAPVHQMCRLFGIYLSMFEKNLQVRYLIVLYVVMMSNLNKLFTYPFLLQIPPTYLSVWFVIVVKLLLCSSEPFLTETLAVKSQLI